MPSEWEYTLFKAVPKSYERRCEACKNVVARTVFLMARKDHRNYPGLDFCKKCSRRFCAMCVRRSYEKQHGSSKKAYCNCRESLNWCPCCLDTFVRGFGSSHYPKCFDVSSRCCCSVFKHAFDCKAMVKLFFLAKQFVFADLLPLIFDLVLSTKLINKIVTL